MAGRKEYEMLFQLNAQLGGSYSKTFKAAQQEIVSMQKEIQALSKTQADISAFQKQQAAVEATRKRLEMLQQQYDNIQRDGGDRQRVRRHEEQAAGKAASDRQDLCLAGKTDHKAERAEFGAGRGRRQHR